MPVVFILWEKGDVIIVLYVHKSTKTPYLIMYLIGEVKDNILLVSSCSGDLHLM